MRLLPSAVHIAIGSILLGTVLIAPAAAQAVKIHVKAGDHDCTDALVSFAVPASLQGQSPLRLIELATSGEAAGKETSAKESPIPAQLDAASGQLWFVARGKLPAGQQRTFRLERGEPQKFASIAIVESDEAIQVRYQDAPLLQYNKAHVEPAAGINTKYGRSGHIHPVRTLNGAVVTDELPPDHLHQSGIFLSFTKTSFEDREVDFWNLAGGKGRVRFKSDHIGTSGPLFASFQTEQEHVDLTADNEKGEIGKTSGGKVALVETWNVLAWNPNASAGYWIFDVESSMRCATNSPLKLPEYHYGGMAIRAARPWVPKAVTFLTSEGADRLKGNHTRAKWCDIQGAVDGHEAGIALFTNPQNFRFPEPLRIHGTMPYMVFTPSFLGDWEITPGNIHRARYRFVVHDGKLSPETLEQLWQNYAQPLVAVAE